MLIENDTWIEEGDFGRLAAAFDLWGHVPPELDRDKKNNQPLPGAFVGNIVQQYHGKTRSEDQTRAMIWYALGLPLDYLRNQEASHPTIHHLVEMYKEDENAAIGYGEDGPKYSHQDGRYTENY